MPEILVKELSQFSVVSAKRSNWKTKDKEFKFVLALLREAIAGKMILFILDKFYFVIN